MQTNASVTTIEPLAETLPPLLHVRIRPDAPVQYEPGQSFVVVPQHELEEGQHGRLYTPTWTTCDARRSITASWREGSQLEFLVTKVSSGRVSPKMFELQAGDRVHMSERSYGMSLRETQQVLDGTEPVLFVSTTSGQVQCLAALELLEGAHTGPVINVLFADNVSCLPYRQVHQALAKEYPNYHCLELLTGRGDPFAAEFFGEDFRQLHERTGIELDHSYAHFYLSGNTPMIHGSARSPGLLNLLIDQGCDHSRIHYEHPIETLAQIARQAPAYLQALRSGRGPYFAPELVRSYGDKKTLTWLQNSMENALL